MYVNTVLDSVFHEEFGSDVEADANWIVDQIINEVAEVNCLSEPGLFASDGSVSEVVTLSFEHINTSLNMSNAFEGFIESILNLCARVCLL